MRMEDMSFRDFTNFLEAEYDLKERQRKEQMKEAEFEQYAKENNLFICTTNILEQIRTEITEIRDSWEKDCYHDEADALTYALKIIDKYAEQEPIYNKLSFPSTFDEFVEQYGITDTDEIYTNGSKLIPAFRVKQWLAEQEPKTGHWIMVDKDKLRCSKCDVIHFIAQYPQGKIAWCPNCGARMVEPQERSDKA